MSSYSHIRYMYLKDNKNNPHSCVVVQLDRESNVINYQIATLSSKEGRHDDRRGLVKAPFVKMEARYIACQRLTKRPFQIQVNLKKMSGHEITRIIMEDIVSRSVSFETLEPTSGKTKAEKMRVIPQRARTSAKRWLNRFVEDRDTTPLMEVAIDVHFEPNDEVINLVNLKNTEALPSSFAEDLASDNEWDSIPIPPTAVSVKIDHVATGVQVVKIREELPSESACVIG